MPFLLFFAAFTKIISYLINIFKYKFAEFLKTRAFFLDESIDNLV